MSDPIRAALMAAFFHRLQAEQPESVLDVGCGEGWLLGRCGAAGIPAAGVEPEAARVARLREQGLDAHVAPAESLPFDDRSFDWVAIRHVSHHLAAVPPALAEAFRVARQGVLVAEPWLDLSLPSQRVARRLDVWLAEQAERVALLHRTPISAGEFLAAVPTGLGVEPKLSYHLNLAPRPEGYLAGEAAEFLSDPGCSVAAREELAAIEAAAAVDGLSYNGSMILGMRILSRER